MAPPIGQAFARHESLITERDERELQRLSIPMTDLVIYQKLHESRLADLVDCK